MIQKDSVRVNEVAWPRTFLGTYTSLPLLRERRLPQRLQSFESLDGGQVRRDMELVAFDTTIPSTESGFSACQMEDGKFYA